MADLSDADRQRIVTAMGELEAKADVILIDTGAGISPNVLAFTRAADHVLVITTPEPTAITDAYAVVKVISRDNAERRVSLLVNQAEIRPKPESFTIALPKWHASSSIFGYMTPDISPPTIRWRRRCESDRHSFCQRPNVPPLMPFPNWRCG